MAQTPDFLKDVEKTLDETDQLIDEINRETDAKKGACAPKG